MRCSPRARVAWSRKPARRQSTGTAAPALRAAGRWPALAGAALRAPLPAPALRAAAAALRAYKYAKEIA